jgi:hypothetical protein
MKKIIIPAIFILITFLITEKACSIPAFARKYRLSCTTCHAPSTPALKPYGDEFAGNGFRLAEEQSPRYFMETGDDKLSLLRELPIAVRLDGFATYNLDGRERADFASPYIVKLLSGGELSDRISYYFYFYFSERGDVAGVEDAFLMYNDLFGIDLDIYLGQFQVSDPLFKRELRLSLEDYVLYTSRIGSSGIDLTYDKGLMVTLGLPSGTGITLEVVNGNGIGEAQRRVFDNDKYKNVFAKVSQDFGDILTAGIFAYSGKEEIIHYSMAGRTNNVFMWGPDITFTPNDKLTLNAQYLRRDDSLIYPEMTGPGTMSDVTTEGAMAELIFMPRGEQSNWYLLALFNWVDSEYAPANYQSATFHAGYLLRRNVRLATEYTLDFTNANRKDHRLSVGFVSAF